MRLFTIICQQLKCLIFKTPPTQLRWCVHLEENWLDSWTPKARLRSWRQRFWREFEVVWQPERTHAGWRVNPDRPRETLLHLYWWLPPSEWWKIYGDGRNFGRKDSVAVTLNVLNNEAMFHGVSYHSPDEYWPLYIFYGQDTKLNLELNLGDPTKKDSLNAWTASISRGHKIFLSWDSKFSDNFLRDGLSPTSLTHSACTTMKQSTQGMKLETTQDFGLNLVAQLKENIPTHFFPLCQPLVTFLMETTAFVD